MVFAPAPLLTVTIERQAKAIELHLHPGGQGVWQARMITSLGAPVTLCVAAGGEAGDVLQKLFADEEMTVRAVGRRSGTGWYVHDRRDGTRTEIAQDPGEPMIRHDIDDLYNMALAEGLRASVSVLSGPADPSVVDADVYRRLAADLTANDGLVVADLSGAHLNAVLDGGVTVVKVSRLASRSARGPAAAGWDVAVGDVPSAQPARRRGGSFDQATFTTRCAAPLDPAATRTS
jgi:1-phosphofructokinase